MPPSDEAIAAMWKKMTFSALPNTLEQHALVKALREVYSDALNVVLAQFKADDDPVFSWYASRNRLPEIGFFERFLRSVPMVGNANRELLAYTFVAEPEFEFLSGFCLGGLLATDLFWGGCGSTYAGSSEAAKGLGDGFFEALAGTRYEEVTVYRSHQAWSAWFQEYGADCTYIILDRRTGIFSLLLLTDSA